MKLSVIIVNYNVKYFLEQCLYSVNKAISGIDAEIIVVDNNSVDGSEAMIRNRFPGVTLIANPDNIGFARANNQAIRLAKGDYVLLLNPDTVVEEQTFNRCISFMDGHPETGALGPKMIDGKGRYLPESKRGLPTPAVAFYKIFGFTRLFPKSRRFGHYYLGYTRNDELQEIEILTGAFMLVRREVFEKIGLLDEEYFMYGEDIDFSYRVVKAGYKIVYFPETTIIHYKGESTRKGSLNYVIIFYKAMQIFARKHFSGNLIRTYSCIINIAIYLRAILSALKRVMVSMVPLMADILSTYGGCYYIAVWWAGFYFRNPHYYPNNILYGVIPLFVLILVLANLAAGGYRRPFDLVKVLKGIGYGLVLVLIVYALLPAQYRFSRVMIILGGVWAVIAFLLVRIILGLTGFSTYFLYAKKKKRIAIVGFEEECDRIKKLLELSGIITKHIVYVYPASRSSSEFFSGTLLQLGEIIQIHRIDEVIFSARDVSSQVIIDNMKILTGTEVDFKIASPGSSSLVGSNSTNSSGDLYVVRVNSPARRK
jgi:O-antigen biosynthesis protein